MAEDKTIKILEFLEKLSKKQDKQEDDIHVIGEFVYAEAGENVSKGGKLTRRDPKTLSRNKLVWANTAIVKPVEKYFNQQFTHQTAILANRAKKIDEASAEARKKYDVVLQSLPNKFERNLLNLWPKQFQAFTEQISGFQDERIHSVASYFFQKFDKSQANINNYFKHRSEMQFLHAQQLAQVGVGVITTSVAGVVRAIFPQTAEEEFTLQTKEMQDQYEQSRIQLEKQGIDIKDTSNQTARDITEFLKKQDQILQENIKTNITNEQSKMQIYTALQESIQQEIFDDITKSPILKSLEKSFIKANVDLDAIKNNAGSIYSEIDRLETDLKNDPTNIAVQKSLTALEESLVRAATKAEKVTTNQRSEIKKIFGTYDVGKIIQNIQTDMPKTRKVLQDLVDESTEVGKHYKETKKAESVWSEFRKTWLAYQAHRTEQDVKDKQSLIEILDKRFYHIMPARWSIGLATWLVKWVAPAVTAVFMTARVVNFILTPIKKFITFSLGNLWSMIKKLSPWDSFVDFLFSPGGMILWSFLFAFWNTNIQPWFTEFEKKYGKISEKWEFTKNFLSNMWDSIKGVVGWVGDLIMKPLITIFNPLLTLIKDIFTGNYKALLGDIGQLLYSWFIEMPVQVVEMVWKAIRSALSTVPFLSKYFKSADSWAEHTGAKDDRGTIEKWLETRVESIWKNKAVTNHYAKSVMNQLSAVVKQQEGNIFKTPDQLRHERLLIARLAHEHAPEFEKGKKTSGFDNIKYMNDLYQEHIAKKEALDKEKNQGLEHDTALETGLDETTTGINNTLNVSKSNSDKLDQLLQALLGKKEQEGIPFAIGIGMQKPAYQPAWATT
jgi:hypothetical protein